MVSAQLRERISQITARRARIVLDHILAYGYVTTDELKQDYGYDHAPRAARDVRELGIPLLTERVRGPNGRLIAAYRLPTEAEEIAGKATGRRRFPRGFKRALLVRDGTKCAICAGSFPANLLQIDHRVPYEVGGESEGEPQPEQFMLLCPSCNRTKSWTCEHCPNWLTVGDPAICLDCLLGSPTDYRHIATEPRRRLTLDWRGRDVAAFERLKRRAEEAGQPLDQYIKDRLAES